MKKTHIFCFIFLLVFFLGGPAFVNADEEEIYDDLAMDSVSIIPSKPAVNQNCLITIKIKNNGKRNLFTSTGLTSFFYDFGDFFKESSNYPAPSLSEPVSPGGYLYYTFSGRFLSAGAKKLSFIVDKANEMTEKNEDNNSGSLDLTVFNLNEADLSIKEISLSQSNPLVNTSLDISAVILNSGKVSLTSDAGLGNDDIVTAFDGFLISGKSRPDYPTLNNPLDPGEIFTYVFSGVFNRIGSNNLKFILDNNQRLAESNESNNSTSTAVSVYGSEADRDDFTISDIKVSAISSSSVEVIWKTSRPTTGYVSYKREVYFSDTKSETTSKLADHKVILEGLEIGKSYYYRVTSQNNTVVKDSADNNYSLPANDELKLASGPGLTVASGNKSAVLKWETNLMSLGYVYYKKSVDSEYKKLGSDTLTINHEITLSDLAAGDYDYYFISTSTPGTVYKSLAAKFSISDSASQEPSGSDSQTPPVSSATPPSSSSLSTSQSISNAKLYSSLKGKIILKVEARGEAYYVSPGEKKMYYLGRPDDAFSVMREQGVGISDINLNKIPIGLSALSGVDSDSDGLPDIFEDAIGTDKNKIDTDNDGHSDKDELAGYYDPRGANKLKLDNNFSIAQAGKIFLQVEDRGEAWYVNPADKKRYFLGRPADAFNVMRNLGLGISNSDFGSL